MPNHAAFKRADVDDARRGHPTSDLGPYAEARGLSAMGQQLLPQFEGLNPLYPEYVFNVLAGEVVPGRFATLQHQLHEISLDDDGAPSVGTFHGRRSNVKSGWRGLIGWEKDPPNEPFAAKAMWVPSTSIKVLVPEVALLPLIVVLADAYSVRMNPTLAAGYKLRGSRWINDELQAALASALGPALRSLDATFVRLEIKQGSLGLDVDGFRSDAADLDALLAAARAIVDGLVRIGAPTHEPSPAAFSEALPPLDRESQPAWYTSFGSIFGEAGVTAMVREGDALGLAVEDPAALHRRFPELVLPGTAMGVLAGDLPDGAGFGRLCWTTQSHPSASTAFRGGAIVEAPPGAPALPLGGVLDPATDMYVASAGGLACAWDRQHAKRKLATADTAARSVAALRSAGMIAG